MAAKKGRGFPKREPTTSHYDVRVGEYDETEAAIAEFKRLSDLAVLRFAKDETVRNAIAEATEAAKRRLLACFERIRFRYIDPLLKDELFGAHPWPEGDVPDRFQWDFIHYLAAVSAVEIRKSPEEWAEYTSGWPPQDWDEFQNAVLLAQQRQVTHDIPKG